MELWYDTFTFHIVLATSPCRDHQKMIMLVGRSLEALIVGLCRDRDNLTIKSCTNCLLSCKNSSYWPVYSGESSKQEIVPFYWFRETSSNSLLNPCKALFGKGNDHYESYYSLLTLRFGSYDEHWSEFTIGKSYVFTAGVMTFARPWDTTPSSWKARCTFFR